jgi:hypothetical protein
MGLLQSKLESELLKLLDPNNKDFVGYPGDVAAVAANWSAAYGAYAQSAVNAGGAALSSPSNALQEKFKIQLISSLPAADSGKASTAAQAFESAFISYWTGAIFAINPAPEAGTGGTKKFSAAVSSVVSDVTPGALSTPLAEALGRTSSDPAERAQTLANAFHVATTTGVVVVTTGVDTSPTPPGPQPIVNTSGIK